MSIEEIKIRASAMQRLAVCPGSLYASMGLPDTASDIAVRGTAIHDLVAKMIVDGEYLDADPELVDAAIGYVERVQRIMDAHGGLSQKVAVEERLEREFLTGQPDAVMLAGDGTAHIFDYKTGWGNYADAEANAQLRAYVVLCMANYSCDQEGTWFAHLLTPSRTTSVMVQRSQEEAIWSEIQDIYRHCVSPDAVRVPSETACRWCRAYGTSKCPETANLPAQTAAMLDIVTLTELPADKLSNLARCIRLIKSRADEVDDELRRRLEVDANSVPGWSTKPGKMRRSVSSVWDAMESLSQATTMSKRDIIDTIASSSPAKVEAALKAGGLKPKQAKEWVAENMAHLIQEKRDRDSLEYVA